MRDAKLMLIDSHAHLDDVKFQADRDRVLERARAAGVETILTIGNGTGPDDMACGLELAEQHDWIYATAGIHPHDASRANQAHFARMKELLGKPRVVAVGETGLDYHYDYSPRSTQRDVFRAQLELARTLDRPVIIHTREADEDTMRMLRQARPRRGVIHCFTGGDALADCALDLGLMISFSGIVTFNRSEGIRAVAARTPEARILVETDCPYLAPVPHRGHRNEPAFVRATAEHLAGLRGVSLEEFAAQTRRNFQELFGLV